MSRYFRTGSLAAALVLSAACAKKQPPAEAPEPEPMPTVDNSAAERARQDSIARENARLRAEREAREAAERARREAESALTSTIYFEFDEFSLDADAQSSLDAKVATMTSDMSIRMRIVGHTDERGSDEYNMALGQRRAAAAKRYMTQRGIDASRIEIVSLGEERPAVDGRGESSWAQNRRDEFEVVSRRSASRE